MKAKVMKGQWGKWFYIIPSLIAVLFITVFPMAYNVWISFTDFSMISPQKNFIGFRNYISLISDPLFQNALQNTAIFTAAVTIISVLFGFFLALVLDQSFRGRALFRVVIVLPWIFTEISSGLFWKWICFPDNVLSLVFVSVGFKAAEAGLLGSPTLAMSVLVIGQVWRTLGLVMILMLSALQSIPTDLVEAMRLEADRWQRFRYLTYPWVLPSLSLSAIITFIASFNVIGFVMGFTDGGPARSTEPLSLFLYETGFRYFQLGYASSIGMIMFIINVIVVMIYLRILGMVSRR